MVTQITALERIVSKRFRPRRRIPAASIKSVKKSFTGVNSQIATTAKKLGLLEIDLDLLLVGRETRPLPDSLAFTSQPFIEGLTWNRDACLSLLDSTGIKLKEGSIWRVPAERMDHSGTHQARAQSLL